MAFWYTFVVPVFQGFDLCDIHGKRPHNPFRSVIPSKFMVFLACIPHYLTFLNKILKCAIDLMQVLLIVLFPSHMLLNNDSNSLILKSEECF